MIPQFASLQLPTQAMAQAMFHFMWQGSALAVVTGCILHVVGSSARMRYAIHLALLLALAACPMVTLMVVTQRATDAPMASLGMSPLDVPGSASKSAMVPTLHPPLQVRPLHALATIARQAFERHERSVVAIWIIGTSLFVLRLVLAAVGVTRISLSRQPLPSCIPLPLDRLVARMGFRKRPVVGVVERQTQAMTIGFLRPMVLLPACWVLELEPDVLEAVVAHELAHARRWDMQVILLQRVVEAALFFHPAVWWCSRCLRVEREMCCDQLALCAIDDRARYANALLFLADQRLMPPGSALAAGIGGTKMVLLERIRNVLGLKSLEKNRFYGPGCALAGAAATSIVWTTLVLSSRQTLPLASSATQIDGTASATSAALPYSSPSPADAASLPTEQRMMTLPDYTIAPPDVLEITVPRATPKTIRRIGAADELRIEIDATIAGARPAEASDSPAEEPTLRDRIVSPLSTVDAGGRVFLGEIGILSHLTVSGMSEEEAAHAILEVLPADMANAKVAVKLLTTPATEPIGGEYLVGPDGTVNLRSYGQVYVAGMTIAEATTAVNEQLERFLDSPRASIGVLAYNSQVYYVVSKDVDQCDRVMRIPITGRETVLDAIAQLRIPKGESAIERVFIARPASPQANRCEQILPVNYREIALGASTATNWQVLPGDRVFVCVRPAPRETE